MCMAEGCQGRVDSSCRSDMHPNPIEEVSDQAIDVSILLETHDIEAYAQLAQPVT